MPDSPDLTPKTDTRASRGVWFKKPDRDGAKDPTKAEKREAA